MPRLVQKMAANSDLRITLEKPVQNKSASKLSKLDSDFSIQELTKLFELLITIDKKNKNESQ